jgi:hypothetical protein
MRATAQALFAFPILRDLADHAAIGCELHADQQAVTTTGRHALAGALLAFLDHPRLAWGQEAIAGLDPNALRIAHLRDGTPPPIRLSATRTAVTAVTALTLIGVIIPAYNAQHASSATHITTDITPGPAR